MEGEKHPIFAEIGVGFSIDRRKINVLRLSLFTQDKT